MSINIIVPTLGESISEATIAVWHKKEGDTVNADETILELETEKVTLEINAPNSGILEKINKPEGENVTVGETVGSIKEGAANADHENKKQKVMTDPVHPKAQDEQNNELSHTSGDFESNVNKEETMSPSVRKLVVENKLNINEIPSTGKDGRVTKEDVLKFLEQKSQRASISTATDSIEAINVATAHSSLDVNNKPAERVRMSRLRKTIAQRLKDSQNTAAILTTFNEIDMSSLMSLRKQHKEEFEKTHSIKLGIMSFFVKAVVGALQDIPSLNAELDGDDIIYKKYYDIGVAVGTNQGLVVPVVRGADKLTFAGIEKSIGALAVKAREGSLSITDLTGGTFTITNGGVYGSMLSTPIINPPQTGIIGLHNTQQRPVVINGQIEIRPIMYVALSYDHRIIDGKEAVTFLVKVKQFIENPERMLLGM